MGNAPTGPWTLGVGLLVLALVWLARRTWKELSSLEGEVVERTRELSEAKMAAERHRDELRTTVEAAGVVPFVFDLATQRFTWTFADARALLGQALEGRVGTEWSALIHPEDRPAVEAAFTAAGGVATAEFRVGKGPMRWLRMVATHWEDGTLRGVVSDVTARKALEVELQHAHRLEAIGQLAAGVAHEINTPVQFIGDSVSFARDAFAALTPYLGLAERLAREGNEPDVAAQLEQGREEADLAFTLTEVPAALERALEGVRRVTAIVVAMKDFARGGVKEYAPADLNRAIENTAAVARGEYKHHARLVFEPGHLPLVPCRLGDVNQVLLNLIVNAAQAIEEKRAATGSTEPGTIRVRTAAAPGLVHVTVDDDGCGIPEAAQGHIFEPFFSTKAVGKGSGQGLALSLAIARRHHGRLWFETRPGEGSTFHLELPVGGPG